MYSCDDLLFKFSELSFDPGKQKKKSPSEIFEGAFQ